MIKILAAPVLLALLLSGCGWAQWPPSNLAPGYQTSYGSKQKPDGKKHPSPPSGQGDLRFTGASAVVAGKDDTVYTLSRRHGVSLNTIIAANRLAPPYKVADGQRIILPREARHVVRRGDTLYGISRSYNVYAYALASANGLKPPYVILAGQSLRIPKPEARASEKTADEEKSGLKADAPALEGEPMPPISAPEPAPGAGGKNWPGFIWPVKGMVLSGFGPKAKGQHNDGLNISAPLGAPVKAAENGVVAYAGNELRGFGNLLLVKHAGGWVTAYAHNDVLLAERGQKVTKGQLIAKVGSTGSVSKPQLHFEIRKGNRAIDPVKHLSGASGGI